MKSKLWLLLFCVFVSSQSCTCQLQDSVQKVWADNDVVFLGTLKKSGKVNFQGVVTTPLKGCLKVNQKVILLNPAPCAIQLPLIQSVPFLVTAKRNAAGKLVVTRCGWTKTKSSLDPMDTLWLYNQLEICPNRLSITCPNNRTALKCNSVQNCDLSACEGASSCEHNACDNCALQYVNAKKQLQCADHTQAKQTCTPCLNDMCLGAKVSDLEGECDDWRSAVTCISNSCFGCTKPAWLDSFGRQVCLDESPAHKCTDFGNVAFNTQCTAQTILGYATINSAVCVPVRGCSPLPPDIFLYQSKEKCYKNCVCADFTNVDMRFNASDNNCNQELGWGFMNNKCEVVKGCVALKNASSIRSSLYPTEDICTTSCVRKQKDYALSESGARPADWVEEANGDRVVPQYSRVFPANKVNRLDFVFLPAEWAAMQANVQEAVPSRGFGGGQRALPAGAMANGSVPGMMAPPPGGMMGPPDGMMGPPDGMMGPPGGMMAPPPGGMMGPPGGMMGGFGGMTGPNGTGSNSTMGRPGGMGGGGFMGGGDTLPDGTCRPLCGSGGVCSNSSSRRGPGGPPGGFPGPNATGAAPRGGFGGRMGLGDPDFHRATMKSEGYTWHNVGVRYKGMSSLMSSVGSGTNMIGFRINMDEFSSDHPETKGQKFFGFSKMTFSNNWQDPSHIREMLAYDIYGPGASRAVPVRVYFDIGDGNGPKFWGLYTMIEDPTDVLMKSFPNDAKPGKGNIYKPENNNWVTLVESDFEKKNNEKAANFSDLQQAFAALHAPTRKSDPAAWRAGLDAVFNVNSWLRTLAHTAVIGNWDSYGRMPHNYYLYNVNGRLNWIPWDFSLSMSCTSQHYSVFMIEVGDQWPLISYLLGDATYRQIYTEEVRKLVTGDGRFVPQRVINRKNELIELVTPHIMGLNSSNGSVIYEPSLPPQTTMPDLLSSFPKQSAFLEKYIEQRYNITLFELAAEEERMKSAKQQEPQSVQNRNRF